MSAENGRRQPTIDDVLRLPASAGPAASGERAMRIEDVAALAGVSPITVSRALRDPSKVADKSRKRILEVVERTGYALNPHARALRSGRSDIVAAFVSNILSPQFGLAVRACAAILEPEGFQLMIGQTSYSYARETAMIRSLRQIRPAAVMFTGVIELEDNRRFLAGLGIPVMETWAYPRDPIDMLVGFSNIDGGRMAADCLADAGYQRVAYVGRSGGRGALRRKGFAARAGERGLTVACEFTVDVVESVADGRAAFHALRERAPEVQAVFFANDLLAVGALMEARRLGLDVPGDIAILGFGDNDLADALSPGLTTLAIDVEALGRRAGEMILKRLRGEELADPVTVFEPVLHRRGSI
ncbi:MULTISPECIES: LacI family DNA-binding transcriptional regulator [Chelatococcus]|uniref:LacI family gluconate utilization system Gnt-I transcriptional repressor n=1 Tax=Chelatococcus caeni TaxID=1348468 RepID=A0A840C2B0_9HYPH|nr:MULTISPECIES: LacI family DNA-binding transcriptional regulator [unclassified Chelatococcus]ALA20164.1 transcriptional regulator [Chelatococcus sp. CO-6]MBB4018953.1 LacI family gluconate utilization system Gnt-I transcriptional repressor [Chelatococcus caeni]